MGYSRTDGWEADYEVYSEGQVESVLASIEVEVVDETGDDYVMCLCPFHGNTSTPAFSVNVSNGKWRCFNPACDEFGTLPELVRRVLEVNTLKAELVIAKHKTPQYRPLQIKEDAPKEFHVWPQEKIDELSNNFWSTSWAIKYMHGRGFEDDTLEEFKVGYSPARITKAGRYRPEMVTVPMHDLKGQPIGLVGRSIKEKRFKNSRDLPKRYTCFNIHRARKSGGSVIIVESIFDAMRVHQAGYPNVIALLGGSITDHQVKQIQRYFNKVIIMTDFDWLVHEGKCGKCQGDCRGHRPGRDLGRKIARKLVDKKIMWAAYDDTCVYPHDAKDAGDMTDREIVQCLRNAIPNIQYKRWGIETLAS